MMSVKSKNIHVLPTDKPSKLFIDNDDKKPMVSEYAINQNIYITSDEGIKEGDWFLDDNNSIGQSYKLSHVQFANPKKIILTTDFDKQPRVQAIDDEFLEWFVKNPSCEVVRVEELISKNGRINFGYQAVIPKEEVISDYDVMSNIVYGENVGERIKIKAKIISKEESKPFKNMEKLTKVDWKKFKKNPIPSKKEETLEEAAISNYKKLYEGEPLNQDVPIDAFKRGYRLASKKILNKKESEKETLEEVKAKAWIDFAKTNKDVDMYSFVIGYDKGFKWQQERMYSEEEVLKILLAKNVDLGIIGKTSEVKEWFEQFKNK